MCEPFEQQSVKRRLTWLSVEISFGSLGRLSCRRSIVVVVRRVFDIVFRGAAVGCNLTARGAVQKRSSNSENAMLAKRSE